jgi:transposase
VEHTRKILGGRIGLVFYDVTTLYFESDYGDELRQTGFSKDGKHSQPQAVIPCHIPCSTVLGMKGYITNTTLPAEQVYEQYRELWVVERAYRVTKGTLEMRPMFHFTPGRIEAHVCICFVAYKVYKELERILKTNEINPSVDKVLAIAKTITTLNVKMPRCTGTYTRT